MISRRRESRLRGHIPLLLVVLFSSACLLQWLGTSGIAEAQSHSHSHGAHQSQHSHEPAHLKYSREVNEAALREMEGGLHSHSHAHEDEDEEDDHFHHDGGCHGHSHNDHSDNDHAHSHSHLHTQTLRDKSPSQAKGDSPTKPAATPTRSQEHVFDRKGYFAFMNDARTRLWIYSIGSTLLISACPFFILGVIPIQGNTSEDSPLLKILLAFGAGGLLGDAFLHLIPHASPASGHSHSHSHSHSGQEEGGQGHSNHDMSVGGWVLTGFFAFFIVEKFVRILRGEDAHSHSHGSQVHHHPPHDSKKEKKTKHSDPEDEDDAPASSTPTSDGSQDENKKKVVKKPTPKKKTHKSHSEKESTGLEVTEPHTSIRVAAYLNFVADVMHNFTDGLAIGASFIAGSTVGFVTMLTVLVHEIPHEIGDFAILVQSGCSKRKAMLTQLLTAVGALAGCIISLWSVDAYALAEAAEQSWVLPFTAGGFIYIATVSVIPELLEKSTFWQSVGEVAAGLLGVYMMYLIALYE